MIDAKKLKAGDKVRRINVGSGYFQFIIDKEYEVHSSHGELCVYDEVGTRYDFGHLKANSALWEHVDTEEEKVGFVRIVNTTWSHCEATEVTVHVDVAGLASIKALESKSLKEEEARGLDAQIAHVEKQLEKLKAERETMN